MSTDVASAVIVSGGSIISAGPPIIIGTGPIAFAVGDTATIVFDAFVADPLADGTGVSNQASIVSDQTTRQTTNTTNTTVVAPILTTSTKTSSDVTWQSFDCADGQIVIAVGNDTQFAAFCAVLGTPDLAQDARFQTNPLRARHREVLVPMLAEILRQRPVREWHAAFDAAGVPSGPINGFAEVFADPQIVHRQMRFDMPHSSAGTVPQVANPVRFSASPVEYVRPPPLLGEHTKEVLRDVLALDEARIAQLQQDKVI